MSDDTSLEHINTLHMFINSVELRLIGAQPRPELEVSCELSNIARGTCVLTLVPVDIVNPHYIGQIEVPISRPVMRGQLSIGSLAFDDLCNQLRHKTERPASVVVALQEKIAVSSHGDLWISETTMLTVRDISWIFPLV